jgi:ATP-binding cassette subfamily C protein CydD/ATP-binding cassette subfamily C protein CydCD
MHPDSQQKLIAYAPQTPHLYQGSLQENLLLLQQAPPERCHQALRLAQLTKWFSTLPQGLDTPLGAGGQPLSQGQLKRLGLARLILQNSPIMLLDEPTSGLDRQLEEKIIRTFSVLAKQRTLIISSHHPALLELADNIIDLNDYLPKEE